MRARIASATSGLVPVAILLAVAAAYPGLRVGLRAATAMTFGALGLAIGFPAGYYLLDGSTSRAHYTGLLAIVAGGVLLLSGPVTFWKARRSGGSRRRRYLRRSLAATLGTVAPLAILTFVVFPIGFSYGYTHVGRTGPPPDLRVPYETVTVTTSDSIELAAS